jgi:hypothetical protein
MLKRRHFKPKLSLKDRLTSFAQETLEMASRLPAGAARDGLIKRAQQAATASQLDDWVNSPGLRPPK